MCPTLGCACDTHFTEPQLLCSQGHCCKFNPVCSQLLLLMCLSEWCCLCCAPASAALHPPASLQMLIRERGAEKGTRGRVRSCRLVCDKIVCVGCPKCFPEAGAKQRINPCQMVPLPGNIRALVCLGKLGEWQ